MAEGMARGTFEIYPDVASRMVALGQGVLPRRGPLGVRLGAEEGAPA